jgi:hypothetical protein
LGRKGIIRNDIFSKRHPPGKENDFMIQVDGAAQHSLHPTRGRLANFQVII